VLLASVVCFQFATRCCRGALELYATIRLSFAVSHACRRRACCSASRDDATLPRCFSASRACVSLRHARQFCAYADAVISRCATRAASRRRRRALCFIFFNAAQRQRLRCAAFVATRRSLLEAIAFSDAALLHALHFCAIAMPPISHDFDGFRSSIAAARYAQPSPQRNSVVCHAASFCVSRRGAGFRSVLRFTDSRRPASADFFRVTFAAVYAPASRVFR